MRTTKRLMALLLVMMMAIGLLAGCGGDEKDPETSVSPTAAPDEATAAPTEAAPKNPLEAYEKKDLGGYEFVVRTHDDSSFTPTDVTGPITEAILERNRQVEEYFNCKIIREHGDYSNHWNDASPQILAGDKWGDLIAPTMWQLSFFIVGDALMDLRTVPTMNLSADYYNQRSIKAGTMNGKAQLFAGDITPMGPFIMGIAFNKRIIEECGLESPYDLVRQDKWNFDTYRDMARAATKELDGDGIMDFDDQWGHTGPYDDYDISAFCATGETLIGEKDGQMQLLFNTPRMAGIIQTLKGLLKDDETRLWKEASDDWSTIVTDGFASGKVLFYGHRGQEWFNRLRDMEDDWGVVPWPKGTPDQKEYCGWVDHNVPIMAIPRSNTDFETSGLIIDAMSAMGRELITPATYEEWEGLYFRDPDNDSEMMQKILDSAYFDATFFLRHGIGQIHGVVGLLLESTSGGGDFASSYEEKAGSLQDALDQFFEQGVYAE